MSGSRQVALPDQEKPLPPEVQAAAAVTVAGNALHADDARDLLAALGLSESAEQGRAQVRARGKALSASQGPS